MVANPKYVFKHLGSRELEVPDFSLEVGGNAVFVVQDLQDTVIENIIWAAKDSSFQDTDVIQIFPNDLGRVSVRGNRAGEVFLYGKIPVSLEEVVLPIKVNYPPTTKLTVKLGVSHISSTMTIETGKQTTFTAITEPNYADTTIIWTTSDPTVATVINGTVKGISPGYAAITATSAHTTTVKQIFYIYVYDDLFSYNLKTNDLTCYYSNSKILPAGSHYLNVDLAYSSFENCSTIYITCEVLTEINLYLKYENNEVHHKNYSGQYININLPTLTAGVNDLDGILNLSSTCDVSIF